MPSGPPLNDQEQNGLIFVEERQVDRLLAQISFSRVLDVGTGTGSHALKLAGRGASVIALDQSQENGQYRRGKVT
jgi:methylase of polypeptide subunit release factors